MGVFGCRNYENVRVSNSCYQIGNGLISTVFNIGIEMRELSQSVVEVHVALRSGQFGKLLQ